MVRGAGAVLSFKTGDVKLSERVVSEVAFEKGGDQSFSYGKRSCKKK